MVEMSDVERIRDLSKEGKKFTSSSGILAIVRSYFKVKYSGRYKAQYTQGTKGQRLIFKALGIDIRKAETERRQYRCTAGLSSLCAHSTTTCTKFLDISIPPV